MAAVKCPRSGRSCVWQGHCKRTRNKSALFYSGCTFLGGPRAKRLTEACTPLSLISKIWWLIWLIMLGADDQIDKIPQSEDASVTGSST